MIKPTPWDEGKIARFVKDWNDGLEIWAIREKYGMRNPWSKALTLRRQGHELAIRERPCTSRSFKSRPEDTRAHW